MNRKVTIFAVTGVLLCCCRPAVAGSIVNKTSWSAEYIRTLNRNAATDYGDIAAYNPAGTVMLPEGLIINGSLQYLGKDYRNYVNGQQFDSNEPSEVPDLFAVYKKDHWALFGSVTVVGGGGTVDYEKGDATTMGLGTLMNVTADRQVDGMIQAGGGAAAPLGTYYGLITNQHLKATNYDLGYSLGAAYSLNDTVSISASLRFTDGTIEVEGATTVSPTATGTLVGAGPLTSDLQFTQEAQGWGAVFGINIAASDRLNIGARFETHTRLDFDTNVERDTNNVLPQLGVVDGAETRKDLAPVVALGLSYQLTDKLRVETDLTLYLNDKEYWDGIDSGVSTGSDTGIAFEYAYDERLTLSVGYAYVKTGLDPEEMTAESPELDAHIFGGGFAYALSDRLQVNAGIGCIKYINEQFHSTATGLTIEYEKNILITAMGGEYRF